MKITLTILSVTVFFLLVGTCRIQCFFFFFTWLFLGTKQSGSFSAAFFFWHSPAIQNCWNPPLNLSYSYNVCAVASIVEKTKHLNRYSDSLWRNFSVSPRELYPFVDFCLPLVVKIGITSWWCQQICASSCGLVFIRGKWASSLRSL